MENQLLDLLSELKSDKVTIRQKAVDKLTEILTNKLTQLQTLLDDNENVTWNDIFRSVALSIEANAYKIASGAEAHRNDKKIASFENLLLKVCESPAYELYGIEYNVIIAAALKVFKDDSISKNFAHSYLLVLQRFVFSPDRNLTSISASNWKSLTEQLFKILKSNVHNIPSKLILDCTKSAVELGCSFSYLAADLDKYLPKLKVLLEKCNEQHQIAELLVIAYHCCINIAVEHRYEVCIFTENIGKYIKDVYKVEMKSDVKEILIKFMDLSIIVHHPLINNNQTDYVVDIEEWNRHLRNFHYILNMEMKVVVSRNKYQNNSNSKQDFSHTLIQFAARLCYLMYWNQSVWNEEEENSESSNKRKKITDKLGSLIELAQVSEKEFNWKWIAVIAELIERFPMALQTDHYQPLLLLLFKYQSTIENELQVYSFTKCCLVMLKRESEFMSTSNHIIASHCQDLWRDICDTTLRGCTSNMKNFKENHFLLQILIYYQKNQSKSFAEEIIKIFISKSTVKCDETLRSLIELMRSFNLDSMENGDELAMKILKYTFEKQTIQENIASNVKISGSIMAEIGAICCLLKTDVVHFARRQQQNYEKFMGNVWKIDDYEKYKDQTNQLVHLILVRENFEFLIEKQLVNDEIKNESKLPQEIKCISLPKMIEELFKNTELKMKVIDNQTNVDEIRIYLEKVLINTELMMNLSNAFIKYEAFNETKLKGSDSTKKIVLNLQEVQKLFGLICSKNAKFEMKETYQILNLAKNLFSLSFHPKICQQIRSFQMCNCLAWINKQIYNNFAPDYQAEPIFTLKLFNNASTDRKIRSSAIETLAQYLYFKGGNDEDIVIRVMTEIELESLDNVDIHTIFKIIQIFGKRKATLPTELIKWIWSAVIEVCRLNQVQYISSCLIDNLGSLTKFTIYDPEIIDYIFKVFDSFCLLTADSQYLKYNPQVAIMLIKQIPISFFKDYHDEEKVMKIYNYIVESYLQSDIFGIRLAAIELLSIILKSDIEDRDELQIFRSSRRENFKKLLKTCKTDVTIDEEAENNLDLDLTTIETSTFIQLFSLLFYSSFLLRKPVLIELSKVIMKFKLSDQISLKIFNKILTNLKCGSKELMDSNSLSHLLSHWMQHTYSLNSFPWYFTGCDSFEIFVQENYQTIFLEIMKSRSQYVEEFSTNIELEPKKIIKDLLPECISFLLPLDAGCDGIGYQQRALDMKRKVDTYIKPDQYKSSLVSDISKIIGCLLNNVYDQDKFSSISGFDLEIIETKEIINYEQFERCLRHLSLNFELGSSKTIFTFFCNQRGFCNNIQKLLMGSRFRIQDTNLKEHKVFYLIQYCLLVEKLFDYLQSKSVTYDIKGFLIREVTIFLTYLIDDDKFGSRLRETAANFLEIFLKSILPICADEFKPFMNKTVSILVTSSRSEQVELSLKCLIIINFLCNNQKSCFKQEISELDKFPDHSDFDDLRNVQENIKNSRPPLTLSEEIRQFLKIKNRKVEGLIELRKTLNNKKEELKVLFEDLSKTMGFTEDGVNNLIHKLIQSLINFIRNSHEDEERAVEAVKCLGEIGTYDLATMVFITEENQNSTIYEKFGSFRNCKKRIFEVILESCEQLLVDSKPKVFKAASEVCYHIFETRTMANYQMSKYLLPFNTNSLNQNQIFLSSPKSKEEFHIMQIFDRNEFENYEGWIKNVAIFLLNFVGDQKIAELALYHHHFAETVAPITFQLILFYENEEINEILTNFIDHFFTKSSEKLESLIANEGSIFINKFAIRFMLKIIECIRNYCQDKLDSKMKMNMNYLNIAKSAQYCEAYFTAVLYCELYSKANDRISDRINKKNLQEIMFKSYSAIGIQEAATLFINPEINRDLYLKLNNLQWQSVLENSVKNSSDENFSKLYHDIQLHSLSRKYSNKNLDSRQFEALWRLADWSAIVDTESDFKDLKSIDFNEEFEKFHYCCLKSLKNGDEFGVKTSILKARIAVIELLKQESLECTQNLYKFMQKSQLLQQIDDFAKLRFGFNEIVRDNLVRKWTTQNDFPQNFKQTEPILVQRNSIFDTADIRMGRRTWIPDVLQTNMLLIIKEAIENGEHIIGIKTIASMRNLKNLTTSNKAELLLKEAQMNFKTNRMLAEHCLQQIMPKNTEFSRHILVRSIAYRLYGELMAEYNIENFDKIFSKYLNVSIIFLAEYAKTNKKSHLVVDVESSRSLSQSQNQNPQVSLNNDEDLKIEKKISENICIFEIIAKYHDREYVAKYEHIKSPFFQQLKRNLENNKLKLLKLEEARRKDPNNLELSRSEVVIKRSTRNDESDIKETQKSLKTSGRYALYFYLRSLLNDPEENTLAVFRILAIWLEESNKSFDVIQDIVKSNFPRIQSWKFLVAFPQLVVRLNDKHDDPTNQILMELLERCAIDHPHHTLPLILSLGNSYIDDPQKSMRSEQEPRVIGANLLWNKIKNNPRIKTSILLEMEQYSEALIELANRPNPQSQDNINKMPSDCKLLKLKNLNSIQCPTIEIPIKKDCNYENSVISVLHWSSQFENIGGINAPKKLTCYCSDGKNRPQLLKGKDDIRQDAVMQQVFGVVNRLLIKNKEMSKRHARMRTYKVVPLSRRSGILEWCQNTLPIGNYLRTIGKVIGAHEKYYPSDMTPNQCSKEIGALDNLDLETKERRFKEICDQIRPAFHHFFLERFKNPGQLFERCLTYTTSVAVSSMVGYILGIGDRHIQNILIDEITAEVVHIDFGYAFETGKLLPHPELVPFRLTRDIIAPMGICGVDGVFRKTCEKTLEILRQNEKTLSTILEVLLYDPLYTWSLTTTQARNRQLEDESRNIVVVEEETDQNEDEKDSMASRALQKVQSKLKGQTDNSSGFSSVEGQVSLLIQQATDPNLLCRLFRGWMACL